MIIKILGAGCANCERLAALAKQAAAELNIPATFEKVKDIEKIVEMGVYMTPGLVIDDVVKSSGKVPALEEIKGWIQAAAS
jgi:small redox-active disulfide protein 2